MEMVAPERETPGTSAIACAAPISTASRGEVEIPSARPQADIRGYRAMFDIKPTDDSIEPIDLRLYLRLHGQPLTETWTYSLAPSTGLRANPE